MINLVVNGKSKRFCPIFIASFCWIWFCQIQYNGSALQANIPEHMDPGTYVATVVACSPEKPPNDTNMIYNITGDTITLFTLLEVFSNMLLL